MNPAAFGIPTTKEGAISALPFDVEAWAKMFDPTAWTQMAQQGEGFNPFDPNSWMPKSEQAGETPEEESE